MVLYCVPRRRIPEIDNVGVISESEYTSVANILPEKGGRPMQAGLLVEPCIVGTACQAMDENDATLISSQ
jgi:hypothetical protein